MRFEVIAFIYEIISLWNFISLEIRLILIRNYANSPLMHSLFWSLDWKSLRN